MQQGIDTMARGVYILPMAARQTADRSRKMSLQEQIAEIDQRLAAIEDERYRLHQQRRQLVAEQQGGERAQRHIRYVMDRYERGESIVQRGRYARWTTDGEVLDKATPDDLQAVRTLCRHGVMEATR